jgi:hypothetical protein
MWEGMRKKLILKSVSPVMFFVTIVAASFVAIGMPGVATALCVSTSDGTGLQIETLFAGQTIPAGTVSTEVVGDFLEITYSTTGGWELVEANLWIGDNLGSMPQTKNGNPKVGQFPYKSGDISGVTEHTFSVPISLLNFSCPIQDTVFYVAAEAQVRISAAGGYRTEGAWADGDAFVESGNWATYFTITLTCDCGASLPEVTCETAYAFGVDAFTESNYAVCFRDIDENEDGAADFNNWGWTNGPLEEGSYEFPLYAGAGKCDINKGTLVGMLFVDYLNGTASLTLSLSEGFTLNETHLYAGNDILPLDVNGEYTVAPGQYPYKQESLNGSTMYWFDIDSLSGGIYVIAHAVVCGDL